MVRIQEDMNHSLQSAMHMVITWIAFSTIARKEPTAATAFIVAHKHDKAFGPGGVKRVDKEGG